jgi:integrase
MRAALHLVGGSDIDDRAGRSSIIAAHLEHMRWLNRSPGTILQREYALARLARFIGRDALTATTEDVGAFRDRRTRAGQPLAVSSQAAELAHLRGFFQWALLEGLLTSDPMLRVPQPSLPRWLPHPIPEHELAVAIDTARDRVRPFFYLAAYAGLRACEIAPLRGEDIWWHQDPALIIVRRGKGGDPGTVPVSPVLEPVLRELPHKGWMFPRVDGNFGPLKAHSVSHLANEHLHATGSYHTIHSCRHRFGTLIYRLSGGDLRLTQEMMRHRSPVSTAVYTQVDQSHAASVVGSLPAPSHLRVAS